MAARNPMAYFSIVDLLAPIFEVRERSMKFITKAKMLVFSTSTATLLATSPLFAEMSAEELAKLALSWHSMKRKPS